MFQKLIFAGTLVASSMATIGCGCRERVIINNSSAVPVEIQLALPHPSYKVSNRNDCHYALVLMPSKSWYNRYSHSADHHVLPLRMANGPFLVRIREHARLIEKPKRAWSVYTLMNNSVITTIRVTVDGEDDLHLEAHDADGAIIQVLPSDLEWFSD